VSLRCHRRRRRLRVSGFPRGSLVMHAAQLEVSALRGYPSRKDRLGN
jgi:hypothetical protein